MGIRAICIAGDAGSGKTTTAREVAARLPGWSLASTGQRFRDYCRAHGIDPSQIASLPDEIHRQFDAEMREFLASQEHVIVDGRLVCWLAGQDPRVLRVWCDAPLDVRAERYARREGIPVAAARAEIERRDRADFEKFQRLYGIDYRAPGYYDLVVDTARLSPAEVAETILARLRRDP